ncbi:adenosylcobinamide kinase /adenosylcobinamide-phosphate guanylyltransferase [Tumebacillus sp. BK434]|uniref:bifunctional adenosylcobinamide kinase/adenosylcobinamide-phosphate guanylyltransferase n=1 Tax=Tumebacillus sp. BK434 TaxID=2512169 RepID=UPI0010463D83|nr:bifunctional adenosylcobinamide kinase/adenosylcobinamide-phosphate guanylyltransferase [Tumebacillus sp. BK434]TCP55787.1 adenosylcobinamide kinase /adenosylcobinamide-phosphate guanylyltransferase [Tumebacillus sp. BK434]
MPYVLVTGGVRSGKSGFAEQRAGLDRRVLYVATGQAWDEEMQQRIRLHRDRRPAQWGLLESGALLTETLVNNMDGWDCVLVDCMSAWLSQILMSRPESELRSETIRTQILSEAERLAQLFSDPDRHAVLVTTETGLGGVALTKLGRIFADLLGEINQVLAGHAEEVHLVIAGRALKL